MMGPEIGLDGLLKLFYDTLHLESDYIIIFNVYFLETQASGGERF